MRGRPGTTGSPNGVYVTLYTALSIDGRIGYPGRRVELGRCEKQYLHMLRASSDAVLVGAGTVIADDPLLTARPENMRVEKQPLRVVLDGRLSTPIDARVYDVSAAPTLVLTTTSASPEKIEELRRRGVEVAVLPGRNGFIEPGLVLNYLYKAGVRRLLVEGGSMVIGEFVEAGLYDRLIVAYTPWLLGGRGVPYLSVPLKAPIEMSLVSLHVCGGRDIIAEYERRRY